ncbi:MAG: very short patch repair endonuclease [Candidatus Methylumidiphilus sp.]
MADSLTPEARSRLMARIHSTGTTPELLLRKALWTAGLRYRLRNALPGKPDMVFPAAKVAVFVDGCFWHGCPLHGRVPQSNQGFWMRKFTRNIARDLAADAALAALGWLPLRFWEHEIREDLVGCAFRVMVAVRDRQAAGS